jgi:hypothetical protein
MAIPGRYCWASAGSDLRGFGEFRFPQAWREVDDPACRVLFADARQDIDQVGVGIYALEAAGDQEALDDTDAFGANLRRGDQPVLAVVPTSA